MNWVKTKWAYEQAKEIKKTERERGIERKRKRWEKDKERERERYFTTFLKNFLS